MKTALFISPHLDDVAFSCGGTLVKLAESNWQTILCTIFTKSVFDPTGFALSCQTDKGLSPAIDYMQLRRSEDEDFARAAGVTKLIHLDFVEAPHRGYESAPDLFAGVHAEDDIWNRVAEKIGEIIEQAAPDWIFAPQGVGNHVDHLQTIRAVQAAKRDYKILWYRDTPYAVKNPRARPSDLLPFDLRLEVMDISATIERKIAGCLAYQTQINFQFGGADDLSRILREFHQVEARRISVKNSPERFAETFLIRK